MGILGQLYPFFLNEFSRSGKNQAFSFKIANPGEVRKIQALPYGSFLTILFACVRWN
jgi:hypothetical protein